MKNNGMIGNIVLAALLVFALFYFKSDMEKEIRSLREEIARMLQPVKQPAPTARQIPESRGSVRDSLLELQRENTLLTNKVSELEKKIEKTIEKDPTSRHPGKAAKRQDVKRGEVISIDKNCNLVVISLGRKDGIEKDTRCRILKNGEKIAEATIIGVRYRTSAAFVDEVQFKHHISNIEPGDQILII